MLDDEMADIHVVRQITFHQQVVLPGHREHFGDLGNRFDRFLGDLIGFAEVALHIDEDRLHRPPSRGAQPRAARRARNAGMWSPKPTTRGPSSELRRSRLAAGAAVARGGSAGGAAPMVIGAKRAGSGWRVVSGLCAGSCGLAAGGGSWRGPSWRGLP